MDPCRITTGLPELDKALGGWRKGGLTTIYGHGSSAICETITLTSAEMLSLKGFKILYLDAAGNAFFKNLNDDNLTLLELRGWDEQKGVISRLFKSNSKLPYDALFIGGLTIHYHSEFVTTSIRIPGENEESALFNSASMKYGHDKQNLDLSDESMINALDKVQSELTYMVYQLAMLAKKNNIPVIASNYIISKERYYIPFVGGAAIGYYSKSVLHVRSAPEKITFRNKVKLTSEIGGEHWILAAEKDPSPLLSNRIIILSLDKQNRVRVVQFLDLESDPHGNSINHNNNLCHKNEANTLNSQFINSGLREMDFLLGGGFRRREIILLFGPTMVGKSYLLRQISINVAKMGYNVLYVDLENSFDTSTIIDYFATGISKNLVEALERLTIYSPNSLDELHQIIKRLLRCKQKYDMIIVDPITYHFYPLIRIADDYLREKLIEMLYTIIVELKKYASLMDGVVIYVAGTRRAPGKYPCLGGALTYEPAGIIIKMMPSKKWDIRRITILDKRLGRAPKHICGFLYIKNDGTIQMKLQVRENELQ